MDVIIYNINLSYQHLIGCATIRVDDDIIVIGGIPTTSSNDSRVDPLLPMLNVQRIQPSTTRWESMYLTTNAYNRCYHAAAISGNKIFIFGGAEVGRAPIYPHVPATEVISLERGIFGDWLTKPIFPPSIVQGPVVQLTPSVQQTLGLYGLTATSITIQSKERPGSSAANVNPAVSKSLERIILFGGYHPEKEIYSNDVHIFVDALPSPICKIIDTDGINPLNKPPPRAFHTATLLQDRYLLVCGGETANRKLLNDFWVLDLAPCLTQEAQDSLLALPIPPTEVTGKGGKPAGKAAGGKAANVELPPLKAVWQKVNVSSVADFALSFFPRSRHCTVAMKQDDHDGMDQSILSTNKTQYELLIFGGFNSSQMGLLTLPLTCADKLTFTWTQAAPSVPEGKGKVATAAANTLQLTLTQYEHNVDMLTEEMDSHRKVHDVIQQRLRQECGHSVTLAPLFADDVDRLQHDNQSLSSKDSRKAPIAWLMIGGYRGSYLTDNSHQEQTLDHALLAWIENRERDATAVKQLKKTVYKANPGHSLFQYDVDRGEKLVVKKRIRYSNGDEYYGQFEQVVSLAGAGEMGSLMTTSGTLEGFTSTVHDDDLLNEIGDPNMHIPQGQGVMKYGNGDKYQGDWMNGIRHGQGVFTLENGDTFSGQFEENELSGVGSYATQDHKITYLGGFVRGRFEGSGTYTSHQTGEKYDGQFAAGERHGEGMLRYEALKCQCTGRWEHGRLVGEGAAELWPVQSFNVKLEYFSESTKEAKKSEKTNFIGNLVHTLAHSSMDQNVNPSVFTKQLRGWYSGALMDGMPQSESGQCVYEDGSEYVGGWKAGRRNGVGKYFFRNGDSFEGKWVGDVRCGLGRLLSFAGNSYDGQFDANVPHGPGMMKYKQEGTVYIGEFRMGKRGGAGKLIDEKTGKVLEEGQYANDQLISRSVHTSR